MLAFEVVLNGQRIATPRAEDLNVLNEMVTAVGNWEVKLLEPRHTQKATTFT
jgi:hypothetical protein